MGMKDVTLGVRLMCIPLLFEGAAICPNARLQREIKFGALAAANVVGEISFRIVALVLLFGGYPQWSLPSGLSARLAAHGLVVLLVGFRLPPGLPRWLRRLGPGRCASPV